MAGFLATNGGNGSVSFGDVQDKVVQKLKGHTGTCPCVWALFKARNTPRQQARDKSIKLWKVGSKTLSNELGTPLNHHTGTINSVAFLSGWPSLLASWERRWTRSRFGGR